MAKWRDVKKNKESSKNETLFQEDNIQSSASLFSRLKAFLVDFFLITTPITYIVMYLVLDGGMGFANNRILGWSLILGFSALFIILFWYIKAQTPGMRAYELKLINTTHTKVSLLQTFIRYIATLFSIISIFLMFMPFFHPKKKTFQDIISKTYLVYV